jgi:hypothetical protein
MVPSWIKSPSIESLKWLEIGLRERAVRIEHHSSIDNLHRVAGEKRDWKEFCEYEKEVNDSIVDTPMLALCTYPLPGSAAAEILDVTRTHQFRDRAPEQRLGSSGDL